MDCFIRKDLAPVFDGDFDMAFTKMERKNNVSSGIYFFRNNAKVVQFVTRWRDYIDSVTKRKEHECLSQRTLSDVIFGGRRVKGLTIAPLPAAQFNRKIKPIVRNKAQREDLRGDDSSVLHFYNRSYQCAKAVRDVMTILGEPCDS